MIMKHKDGSWFRRRELISILQYIQQLDLAMHHKKHNALSALKRITYNLNTLNISIFSRFAEMTILLCGNIEPLRTHLINLKSYLMDLSRTRERSIKYERLLKVKSLN